METTEPQKYDPDDYDPVVIPDRQSKWVPAVCLVSASIAVLLLAKVTWFSPVVMAYKSGNWGGKVSFLEGLWEGIGFMFLSAVAVVWALGNRRYILSLCLLVCLIGAFQLGMSSKVRPDWHQRFNEELPHYKQAIRSNIRFGDQYSEVVRSRKLTYWRWIQYGLDNAVGVTYDPSDTLSQNEPEDGTAFRQQTSGGMFRLVRVEPHWYFVEHS